MTTSGFPIALTYSPCLKLTLDWTLQKIMARESPAVRSLKPTAEICKEYNQNRPCLGKLAVHRRRIVDRIVSLFKSATLLTHVIMTCYGQ